MNQFKNEIDDALSSAIITFKYGTGHLLWQQESARTNSSGFTELMVLALDICYGSRKVLTNSSGFTELIVLVWQQESANKL